MISKIIQKILFFLAFILSETQGAVYAGNFEKFETLVSNSKDLIKLERWKKEEYQKFKRTNNKYYLYNSKCVQFNIDLVKNNHNSALIHLNFILNDAKQTNTEQIAWVNYYMARTLISIDAMQVGTEYALRALKIVQKKKYPKIIHRIYNEMGLAYYKHHKYAIAAEYFRKSYESAKLNPHLKLAAVSSLNDIGVANHKMKKNKIALWYYKAAASLLKNNIQTYKEESMYNLIDGNMGGVLFDLKEYDTAITLLEKEVRYYYAHPEFLDIGAAKSMIFLVKLYEIKKNQKKVDQYITALRKLEKEKPDHNLSILIDESMYDYYIRNKDQKKAMDLSQRIRTKTKLNNEKSLQKLSFLSDLVYKQKITRLKENTKTNSILLKHAINEKKKSQLVSFFIILFCLVIVLFS